MCDHRTLPRRAVGAIRRVTKVSLGHDNVTSPFPGGRAPREGTRRLLTPRRSGARVDGMANSSELLINVVRSSKPRA